MGEWECPLCGSSFQGNTCTTCGYAKEPGLFGDNRDIILDGEGGGSTAQAMRKRKRTEAIHLLKEAANSSPPPEWAVDVIPSSLKLLSLPLTIESLSNISISLEEATIVQLCHGILSSLEPHGQGLSQPPEVYLRLGNAFFLQGDRETSLEYYKKAVLRKPSFEQALFNQAYVLFLMKDYGEAKRNLDKLLSKHPKNQRAIHLKELVGQLDEKPA